MYHLKCFVVFWIYWCLGKLTGVPVTDYRLYFVESESDFETSLDEKDFLRGKLIVDEDWDYSRPNPLALSGKFEGDIDGIDENGIFQNQDVQQNAIRPDGMKWQNGVVPYMISSHFSSYSRAQIAAAMSEFSEQTCIRFLPRTSQSDYVYIVPDQGCYSMVGRLGGRQIISLGYGCIHKGIIMHELMHVSGFFHEQSRTDRDDYVEVVWNNVLPGMRGQFRKYLQNEIQYLGTTYDYNSIMHYGPTDFSSNGRPTIQPLKSNVQIGQRRGFSTLDRLKINRLYNCNQQPATPLPTAPATPPPTVPPPRPTPRPLPRPLFTPIPTRPETRPTPGCVDKLPECGQLARDGHCELTREWMAAWCPNSCGRCGSGVEQRPRPIGYYCLDSNNFCAQWAHKGFCLHPSFRAFMTTECRKSCEQC